ncbi:hypothetical protein PHLCEN_2v8238, partial [Hermanssonia centrifuga]
IMKRASSARGHLRDKISELIVEFYKIKLETGRKKVREENEQCIHYLMEGSPKRFCYKDYDRSDPRGYTEVRLLLRGLQQHLFKNHRSLGAEYVRAFKPLPLPTLALLLTIVRSSTSHTCLDTWATGEFNSQVTFKESEYRPRYKKHLEQLKQWEEINSVVVQKIREKMFERIVNMGNLPVQPSNEVDPGGLLQAALKHVQEDLACRTGDTDSEDGK